jgi:hypothetical protein
MSLERCAVGVTINGALQCLATRVCGTRTQTSGVREFTKRKVCISVFFNMTPPVPWWLIGYSALFVRPLMRNPFPIKPVGHIR